MNAGRTECTSSANQESETKMWTRGPVELVASTHSVFMMIIIRTATAIPTLNSTITSSVPQVASAANQLHRRQDMGAGTQSQ